MDTPNQYDPLEQEEELLKKWEDERLYEFEDSEGKENFVIDTPPPTVSGKMHVGHACSYSHGDMIARYKRMNGYDVYYPFGTDDNGLPTERLVEKKKDVDSLDMTRKEFRELCRAFLEEERPSFVSDWKRLGSSCDFENMYSTIDEKSIKTSQKSFLDLHKKGLLDRRESPVSWCPECQTSIAQAEFENLEMTSHMNKIVFKKGGKELLISTTRPELLGACVCLAFHPDDSRYKDLEGSHADVPLFGHEVPIVSDKDVDAEKGTGLMMVCTFGDKEDVEKWHRHNLPLRTIFTEDGKINDELPEYEGLEIREARKQIIQDLEKEGALVRRKKITHNVNVHERCDTPIEFLKTEQWFVEVLNKKDELMKKGKEVDWQPSFMEKRFQHWVEGLQWDWCISRQRHFGVPFPVWYSKKTGEIILADEDDLPVDPLEDMPSTLPEGHTEDDIVAEKDVMDTWATSANTPQIILDWAEDEEFHDENLPVGMRHMAHDIIRTWAFYTITKNHYHFDKKPWENVMTSGHVLDPDGNKMSKSKGNVVDPSRVIDEYGADALRYWAATSKLGEDFPYKEKDVKTGRKTVNKIWNASKFAFMNLESLDKDGFEKGNLKNLEVVDEWMLTKLMNTIKTVTENFDAYEYSKARKEINDLFWNTFCDDYLEFTKYRVYGDDARSEKKAQTTLYFSVLQQIKMFAPIMPYITDFVYRTRYKDHEGAESIHVSEWPTYDSRLVNEESEKAGDLLSSVIKDVRKFKSSNGMSLKKELSTVTIECDTKQKALLERVEKDLKEVGNVNKVTYKDGDELHVEITP